MDAREVSGGLEEYDHALYEEEARERWGHTDAYKESARRTKAYSQEDWDRLGAESEAILNRWIELMVAGREPTDEDALEIAEEHRLHLDRWFYTCSHEMHALLAEGYVSDARFRAYHDRRKPGLAEYVSASIRSNSARQNTSCP
ncbi:MAG: TipAS antibiotic-recognition domain-containing protein [Coriobacteriia bacterium]|jgi:hypothetical protein|nr:TipAS antibiotic-recognition domain-containing protein [Coriobacteriia bacterium]